MDALVRSAGIGFRRFARIARSGTLVVALAPLLLAGCGGEPEPSRDDLEWPEHLSPLPEEPPPYRLGELAPDLRIPVFAGPGTGSDTVVLRERRGAVLALNFWSVGCAPCVAEHATLNAVAERYAGIVEYYGVTGETAGAIAAFEAEHEPFAYPNLADPLGRVGAAFEQRGVPLHVVIDTAGRVAWWRPGGPIREEVIREVIEDVLHGRRPTAFTPAAYPPDPAPRGRPVRSAPHSGAP